MLPCLFVPRQTAEVLGAAEQSVRSNDEDDKVDSCDAIVHADERVAKGGADGFNGSMPSPSGLPLRPVAAATHFCHFAGVGARRWRATKS
jgi:hypothetical protein